MSRIKNQFSELMNTWMGKIRMIAPRAKEQHEIMEKYNRFDDFIFLWNRSFNKTSVTTKKEITFSNYFSFGSNFEFIKKLIGKPVYSFENKEFDVNILMYMIDIRGFKVKFELHFYDKKLFCINYSYKWISEEEKENIIASLIEKYQVDASCKLGEQIILDQSGNGIVLDESDHFSVNYISPNSRVYSITHAYMMGKKQVV